MEINEIYEEVHKMMFKKLRDLPVSKEGSEVLFSTSNKGLFLLVQGVYNKKLDEYLDHTILFTRSELQFEFEKNFEDYEWKELSELWMKH